MLPVQQDAVQRRSVEWNLHRRGSPNERVYKESSDFSGFSALEWWEVSPLQRKRLSADVVFDEARGLVCLAKPCCHTI